MNEREHCGGTGPPPESMLRPPPLGRAAFGAAVRAALPRPRTGPTGSPATRSSAAVARRRPRTTRPRRAIEAARGPARRTNRRATCCARVLHRTFVRAAPTQEAAAEVLGLPFSTYRRHLAKALDRLDRACSGRSRSASRCRRDVGSD